MKKYKLAIYLILGLLITFLGYYLRLQQFGAFPPLGDTEDELKSTFNGISLIETGKPRSWAWFPEYGDFPVIHIRNDNFRLVEPWFDEPPLFSLVSGYYAISKGMKSLDQIDAGVMRYLMIKVAALNIFLLFLVIYLLRGPLEASLGALIYATEPTIAMGSRMPISENMIVTATLASLLLFVIFLRKKNNLIIILSAIIASSALLMKTTGVFVSVALIFLSLAYKQYKASLIFGGFLLSALVAWLLYGAYYNWDLFLKITALASGRELVNPAQIFNLFETFRIGEKMMSPDGWIIWGWISVVAYSVFRWGKDRDLSEKILPVMIGSYLVFFSIMSGHSKGWYKFPFYPFLAWASAAFILETVKRPKFLTAFFFISIPVAWSYIYGLNGIKFSAEQVRGFQIFSLIIFAPFLFYQLFENTRLRIVCQTILILAFTASIIFNIRIMAFYQDYFWYH